MAKLSIMKGTPRKSELVENKLPDTTTNYDKGELLAQKVIELRDLEKEKSETVSGYNDQIKQIEAVIQALAGEIKSGQENIFTSTTYPEAGE